MKFDWRAFCKSRRIAFEERGKNVVRGNITIRCPWCGTADSSGHMGLSLDINNPVWGCLRNAGHRGKDPARLIAKVLGCSLEGAQAIVGSLETPVDDFEAAVQRLRDGPPERARNPAHGPIEPPKEFRTLMEGGYAHRFVHYLWDEPPEGRGFGEDTPELVVDYELWYAVAGDMAWRLIFPVWDKDSKLQGWTGRDIRKTAKIRYLTSAGLPADAILDFAAASAPPDPLVWLVCEGPLDALKLDYYGAPLGIRACATMGTGNAGLDKAAALRARYPRRGAVFDADATAQALGFAEEIGGRAYFLPPGVKDPGELTEPQAKLFLQKIAEKL